MKRTVGHPDLFRLPQWRPGGVLASVPMVLFAVVLIASQTSCISTGSAPPTIGFVEPPREELAASMSQTPIKASDVLQLKLPDGTKASVTQTFQVSPDGTIEISGRGKIQVAGKTLQQAQSAVEAAVRTTQALEQSVELAMSEYYLVTVDANGTKQLSRVPIKGDIRVRDALGKMKVSDKVIWIARPDASRYLSDQLLAVDWESIAHDPNNRANYKLQPGDWLFVAEEPAKGFARVYNAFAGMGTLPKSDLDRAP